MSRVASARLEGGTTALDTKIVPQSILEVAKQHIMQGWSVIPVGNDKRPVGAWQTQQTTPHTLEKAQRVFTGNKVQGLAVVCGAVSNVTILDFEAHSLELPEVQAILEAAKHVPRARSGGGGLHLFFAHSSERNKPLMLDGQHIGDVRGEGGYIVLPPSAHPSGNVYQWEAYPQGDLEPIPPSIQAMLETLTKAKTVPAAQPQPAPTPRTGKPSSTATSSDDAKRKYALTALENECQAVEKAPTGVGNNQINTSAYALGQFVGAGVLSESEVQAALENAVNTWGHPDPNARNTIRSGLTAGMLEPRDMSDVGKQQGKKKSAPSSEQATMSDVALLLEAGQYGITSDHCTVETRKVDSATTKYQLANFAALIVAETLRDDGSDTAQNLVTLEGKMQSGRTLPRIDISASSFAGLTWITQHWGTQAIIATGQNTKDKLRYAIQVLSAKRGYSSRHVYAHTGWRKLEHHGWVYFHGGGAIGQAGSIEGLEVDLSKLEAYRLPTPCTDHAKNKAAIQASLATLETAPDTVALNLWMAVWRSVLGVTRYSIFLYGTTGTAKSGIAGLMLSHFGDFNRFNLSGSWESTAATLERLLFTLKDAPAVIDDFNPRGSQIDRAKLHNLADRLLRGQGNGQARQRSHWGQGGVLETGTSYVPRGLCIVTGEDIPTGQSLRARNLILEVQKGDVNLSKMATSSQDAKEGKLSQAMSAYVQWLASDLEQIKQQHQTQANAWQLELLRAMPDNHGRTSDAIADLLASMVVWCRYALESSYITLEQADDLTTRAKVALIGICGIQAQHQAVSDPVRRFLELLGALFSSGKAHVLDSATGLVLTVPVTEGLGHWGYSFETRGHGDNAVSEWQPSGVCIGWLGKTELYLIPDVAYAQVQTLASQQGDGITKSKEAIYKAMGERGLITRDTDSQGTRNTVRRRIAGQQMRVLALHLSTLEQKEEEITKGQGGGVNKIGHIGHSKIQAVSDDVQPVTGLGGVTGSNRSQANQANTDNSSRLEGVTGSNRSQAKTGHGLEAVYDDIEPTVTDVTDKKHSTPLTFREISLEGEL